MTVSAEYRSSDGTTHDIFVKYFTGWATPDTYQRVFKGKCSRLKQFRISSLNSAEKLSGEKECGKIFYLALRQSNFWERKIRAGQQWSF